MGQYGSPVARKPAANAATRMRISLVIVPPASCQEEFDFSATGARVDIETFPVHEELAHIPQYERPGTRAFVELHAPRQHHRLPATQAVQLAVDRRTRGGWRRVGNEAFGRRRAVGA